MNPNGKIPTSSIVREMRNAVAKINQLEAELSATQNTLACVVVRYGAGITAIGARRSLPITNALIQQVGTHYNNIEIQRVPDGIVVHAIPISEEEPPLIVLP